ncbi:MAG: hypothetical protein DMG12_22700 [Acidobacteria bacterium]|nr:MAG: hypothetical protein DMG12_22700 [Acidobacteriota bacterium]
MSMSEHDASRREFLVRAAVGAGAVAGAGLVPETHAQTREQDRKAKSETNAPAGVLNYIDLALAGAYADLQDFYRRGLAQLDAYCRKTYNEPFVRLSATRQDEVITALDEGKAGGFTWPTAQEFFNTIRTHTMEGMFADPIYGGNKDFAGWRLVGFPGAQAIFTPADMQSKQAFTRAPILSLQAQAQGPTRKE